MDDSEKNTAVTKAESCSRSPSPPSDASFERSLLLKLDFRIIPILFCLFVVMLIDRVNIGNVKIEGILKDLHMVGNDYNIALLIFTVPFIVFELPSTLALRRFKPNVWIGGIMFGWGECLSRFEPLMVEDIANGEIGVCTVGEGLTRSFPGLLACRFLVGMFEAGFAPCRFRLSLYVK